MRVVGRVLSRDGLAGALVAVALATTACAIGPGGRAARAAPGGAPSDSFSITCSASPRTTLAGGIDTPLPGAELAGTGSGLIPNGDFTQGLKGWIVSDPETARLEDR